MKIIIKNAKIYFYDNDKSIMSMDFESDEFIWTFYDSNIINISSNTELYKLLDENIMKQDYIFSNDVLKCVKDSKKLIWFSDCYYNQDDEFSKNIVSYLTIAYCDNGLNIWCTKPLDRTINRSSQMHVITFSPAGNGRYSKNIKTGSTLQDDVIINVYNKLLEKNKCKKLKYKYDGKE